MTALPLCGRVVELLVIARRFRCDAVLCGRPILTERFADGLHQRDVRRGWTLSSITLVRRSAVRRRRLRKTANAASEQGHASARRRTPHPNWGSAAVEAVCRCDAQAAHLFQMN
ncbi:hypothetical protein [Bradyrhizobium manausense]|uniref:hypothetical protein n=1 Tax=Bradyrhizobium manausense TaxID=989370 RepID=UPI003D322268